jgi:quercetin dioxygenase-like cupin family protein
MIATRAKAPTIAWLLTALTCLLAGMAIVESRHQAVALPVWAPVDARETAEVARLPTGIPAPTPTPILGPGDTTPSTHLLATDLPLRLATGSAVLRVSRLTVPPGTDLPPEAAPGPTMLLVETGTLAVRADGDAYVGQLFGAAPTDTVLRSGERLVVAAGAVYAVRNDGPTAAAALVVAIEPVASPPDQRWLPVG